MLVNLLVRRWLCVATIILLVGGTGLCLAQEPQAAGPKPKDIVEVAKGTSDLATFCKLLESAGLVDTLKGKGMYTVFAPTDAAFKKLGSELDELQKPENKAKLQRILKSHIVEGRKSFAEVEAMKTVKTMSGEELKVSVMNDVVTINKGKVTKSDTAASNGLIHVVDTVLVTG